jgi:hypothetical protein
MNATPRGPHPNDLIAPVDWALLAPQHPLLCLPDCDLIMQMLWHVEHLPGLTNDERNVCTDLALHARWISKSGTKASGRWPGFLRLGIASEVGAFRCMQVVDGLERSHRMAHNDEEWVLDLLGPRWEALKAQNAQEQHERPTQPPSAVQVDWGDTHGMGAL